MCRVYGQQQHTAVAVTPRDVDGGRCCARGLPDTSFSAKQQELELLEPWDLHGITGLPPRGRPCALSQSPCWLGRNRVSDLRADGAERPDAARLSVARGKPDQSEP